MRRFSRVNLLLLSVLLLIMISPSVATVRGRELLVAAAIGDQGRPDQPEASVKMKDAEETTSRRRMDERLSYRRFGTRKTPPFGGRIPFTSDYGRIKRHPPKHN